MLSLVNWSWVFGLFGMFVAVLIYQWIAKQPNGTELMQKIERYIYQGAMAFLKRQYTTLAIFVVIVFFFSGSVMGLSVASLGILGVGIWFLIFGGSAETAQYISGYAMGASSI